MPLFVTYVKQWLLYTSCNNYISFSGEVWSQKNRLKGRCTLINATIQPLQIKTVLTLAAEYIAYVFVG